MGKKTLFLLPFILLLGILLLIPSGKSATKRTVYAIKDSYVDSYRSNNNYGGQTPLYCGMWGIYSIYEYEAYIYFDLSTIKSDWDKVSLYLDFWLVSQTMYFDVIKLTNSWNEFSITWNNKLSQGVKLISFAIPEDGRYFIDVSTDISGSVFSICICASYYQDEYVWISSREDSWEDDRPHLVFEYPTTQGEVIGIIVGIFCALGAIGLVIYIIIHQQNKKDYCPNCGEKVSSIDKFCENCGFELQK